MNWNHLTNFLLFVGGIIVVAFGCWGAGKTADNWQAHDERVNKIRRAESAPNSWTPVRPWIRP